jgi:hypothetical protein
MKHLIHTSILCLFFINGCTSLNSGEYIKEIDRLESLKKLDSVKFKTDKSDFSVFFYNGMIVKVYEDKFPSIKKCILELPNLSDIDELVFKNFDKIYFSIKEKSEIKRIIEILNKHSYKKVGKTLITTYYFPNGESYQFPPLSEVLSVGGHGCRMGLFFKKGNKYTYEISGHIKTDTEWNTAGRIKFRNEVFSELLKRYAEKRVEKNENNLGKSFQL